MEDEQKAYLAQLCQLSPEIAELQETGQRFSRLLREKDVKEFDRWLEDVSTSRFAEMKSFANGLRRDRQAVEAALCHPWSNGQTEGQVNRLKTLKRQMYGRAKFDLLKTRVLAVP